MTAAIHDRLFDAALNYLKTNGLEAQVRTAASAILIDNIALNAANYTGPADSDVGGGGRMLTCLVEDAGDMSGIPVDTGGDASLVTICDGSSSSLILVQADITGATITLGADDEVNLSSFKVALKDPT